jgi:serine/threonine protein kinase/tetratricopeptide (TPR) repeat protein
MFHEALDLSPDTRDSYIQSQAGGDSALAACVHRLIQRVQRPRAATMMVDRAAVWGTATNERDADHDLIDVTIGRFKIVGVLGRGGFGCVYRAEQREPIQRDVALKILHSGVQSEHVVARFEVERQALALMQHANIAQVFDAGRTGPELGARPYFAMELVCGEPITSYCNEHTLSHEQRLELFILVCHGVQHAHQKGIIHRDLKPSNILVSEADGAATPKIIDFGIAKAMHRPIGGRAVTEARQLLGTPQYMSPEQADMDVHAIDTRSDIYSLGVVLYELLTGTTPLAAKALQAAPYSQMQAMIRAHAVEKPSARSSRLAEAQPSSHREREAARRLRGDLDWITLKALEHDRDRRYSSAAALADDIQRHLDHRPVLAGPPGLTYRLSKFVRRNRLGVLAAAMVCLAVLGGTVGTTLGMFKARTSARLASESASDARAVNDFMRQVLTSADPAQSGSDVRLVEVLGQASSAATVQFADRPLLQAEVRDLLGSVYSRLGMWQLGEGEFREAKTIWESHVGPDDRRTLMSRLNLGLMLANQRRGREAEQCLQDLLPRMQRVFGPDAQELIVAETGVAEMLKVRGRLDEAEHTIRSSLQRAETARLDGIEHLRLRALLSLTSIQQLKARRAGAGQADIEAWSQSAQRLLIDGQRLGKQGNWYIFNAQLMLADVALLRGEFDDAAAYARKVLADSQNQLTDCHSVRTFAMVVLAKCASHAGQFDEAANHALQIVACERTLGSEIQLIVALNRALQFLERAGRWSEAAACAMQAIQTLQTLGSAHVGPYRYQASLAKCLSFQGRHEEAEEVFQSLLGRYERADADERGIFDRAYAAHLRNRGDFDQAEQRLKRVASPADGDDDTSLEFIALYDAWGKPEQAAEYRARLHRKSPP